MIKIKRIIFRKNNDEIKTILQKVEKLEPVIYAKQDTNHQKLLDYIYWEKSFEEISKILKDQWVKEILINWIIQKKINKIQYDKLKILYRYFDISIENYKEFNLSNMVCLDKIRWNPIVYNRNW